MIVIVMGASGSGKTTIGRLLAEDLGWPFHDGDDFHPPGNVDKMRAGTPLTDADRAAWLDRLRRLIEELLAGGRSAVVACSALKQIYRDRLSSPSKERALRSREAEGSGTRSVPEVRFVYLRGDYELLRQRHWCVCLSCLYAGCRTASCAGRGWPARTRGASTTEQEASGPTSTTDATGDRLRRPDRARGLPRGAPPARSGARRGGDAEAPLMAAEMFAPLPGIEAVAERRAIGPADTALLQVKTRNWPSNAEMEALRLFLVAAFGVRKLVHRWRERRRVPDVWEV